LFSIAGGMIYFLSIYLVKNRGLSVASASMSLSFYGAGSLLGSIIGGKLYDKYRAIDFRAIIILFSAISFIFSTSRFL